MPVLLWIGLGNIGQGMAKNIAEKGNLDQPFLVYNRTTQTALDFQQKIGEKHVQVVKDLKDGVSKANVILACLTNDAAIDAVISQLVDIGVKDKLIIDCSTVHPDTSEKTAKTVTSAGGSFVAAPVFGAPAAAEAGQLISVLAGPAASVSRAKSIFDKVTSKLVIDMSDKAYGSSTLLKLIGNSTLILGMVSSLAEAHTFAEKSGLGSDYVHQLIEGLFPGPHAAYSKRMISGDYFKREKPLFSIEGLIKDLSHAENVAGKEGLKLRGVDIGLDRAKKVKEHDAKRGDIAGIYGAVREESGEKFENS